MIVSEHLHSTRRPSEPHSQSILLGMSHVSKHTVAAPFVPVGNHSLKRDFAPSTPAKKRGAPKSPGVSAPHPHGRGRQATARKAIVPRQRNKILAANAIFGNTGFMGQKPNSSMSIKRQHALAKRWGARENMEWRANNRNLPDAPPMTARRSLLADLQNAEIMALKSKSSLSVKCQHAMVKRQGAQDNMDWRADNRTLPHAPPMPARRSLKF